MKNKIIVIAVCAFFASCKCKKVNKEITHTRIEKVLQKDTVFYVKPDSSQYKANVIYKRGVFELENIKEKKSASKSLNVPKVKLQNNQLQVDCYLDEQKLYAKWKETHVTEQKNTIQKIEVAKPLAFWQKALMYCGGAFIALLLFMVFKIIRK